MTQRAISAVPYHIVPPIGGHGQPDEEAYEAGDRRGDLAVSRAPGRRVVENKHSTEFGRARMTHPQGERSYRRADEEKEEDIQRRAECLFSMTPLPCQGTRSHTSVMGDSTQGHMRRSPFRLT